MLLPSLNRTASPSLKVWTGELQYWQIPFWALESCALTSSWPMGFLHCAQKVPAEKRRTGFIRPSRDTTVWPLVSRILLSSLRATQLGVVL